MNEGIPKTDEAYLQDSVFAGIVDTRVGLDLCFNSRTKVRFFLLLGRSTQACFLNVLLVAGPLSSMQ
jgi:hypothetical protein